MKEKAEKAGFRPGVVVRVTRATIGRDCKRHRRKELYQGEIIAMYKHIFTVRNGDKIESFRYDQIFADEEIKVIL